MNRKESINWIISILKTEGYNITKKEIISMTKEQKSNGAKCICLSRVSTEKQDLNQQTEELIKAAHSSGYTDNNIIIIEDKESGVKLSFEQREGLDKLLNTINTEEIERVIVYEISRIARRADVFYKIRDILVEKKIQLQVLTPGFFLLNEDGSINENSNLLIGIFLSMSESEHRLMKKRMARGKEKSYSEGKFIGGGITFGYRVNEKGYLEADEDNANVVKMIFDMYIKGHSCQAIAKEMISLGLLWHKKLSAARSYIFSLVRNPIYATGSSDNNYNYRTRKGLTNTKPTHAPKIITMDVWNKAQEINLRENPYRAKRERKNIYFAHGIITDKKTGSMLGPDSVKWVYRTCLSEREKGVKMLCINIDMVDSLLWYVAKEYIILNKDNDRHKSVRKLREEQKKCFLRISTLKDKNDDLQAQIDRIEERIIEGRLDEDKGNEMQEKRYDEMTDNEVSISSCEERIEEIQRLIEEINLNETLDLSKILTDEQRNELVHKYIKSVEVEKLNGYNFNVYINGDIYQMNTHQKTKWIKYNNEVIDYEYLSKRPL